MAEHPVTEVEEWREIPGHPGYEASTLGRLKSVDRIVTSKDGRSWFQPGVLLRVQPHENRRYLTAHLGQNHSECLHSLICKTFHGPRPSPKHEVAHWNNDGHDNRVANLRWATRVENRDDQHRHRTRLIGSKNHKAILNDSDVRAIRALHKTGRMSHRFIAELFKTDRANVTLIVNRVNWKHLR